MTKQQIIDRINQLSQEAENLKGHLAATMGAIQDCQFWLQQLDASETAEKPE